MTSLVFGDRDKHSATDAASSGEQAIQVTRRDKKVGRKALMLQERVTFPDRAVTACLLCSKARTVLPWEDNRFGQGCHDSITLNRGFRSDVGVFPRGVEWEEYDDGSCVE